MKAAKVYSNNSVSTVFPDGREAILIGSGIGFGKRPGDEIDSRRIEKTYYIQDDLQTKFLQLLKDTRPEVVEAAEQILQHARECGLKLKNQLIISLTDHISFALERFEKKIDLPYLMLTETRMLYPREYEIGRWALERIRQLCGVTLPEYEAGYIALQLASSSFNRETTYKTLKLVSAAMDIIKQTYGIELDPDQIETGRLTTHLKFLAQRIFTQVQWEDKDMDGLREMLIRRSGKGRQCIQRLSNYIFDTFGYRLNSQEEVYLLIHLTKLFDQ